MTYVFDIDGTICTNTGGEYENAEPYNNRIEKINELYEEGHKIVFNTARGMGRNKNCSKTAIRMFFDLTYKQLNDWKVKYHSLILGKPAGDIYIDDKGMNDESFFAN